jgi:hypothetical protein
VKQLSLFHESEDDAATAALAGLVPLIRATMARVAEEHPTLSRDLIADRMTEISRSAGVKLSRGNATSVKTTTLDKWLAPAERDHPPSLPALMAFCMATRDVRPLLPLLKAMGCEVMTPEDRKMRDYGKAILAEREAKKLKRKLEADLD